MWKDFLAGLGFWVERPAEDLIPTPADLRRVAERQKADRYRHNLARVGTAIEMATTFPLVIRRENLPASFDLSRAEVLEAVRGRGWTVRTTDQGDLIISPKE